MLFNQKAPTPILPKSLKKINHTDIDPLELARQITDIEANLYRAIQPKECLNQAWNKAELKYRSPNIIAFIHHFNSVSLVSFLFTHTHVYFLCATHEFFLPSADPESCR